MIIAIEDQLSEAALRALVARFKPDTRIAATVGLKGKDYLRNRAVNLNRTATAVPVTMLIDLDVLPPCPGEIIATWFPNGLSAHMMFRVAVFEVESWLMADRQGMAQFLGVSQSHIPKNPDSIPDPKQHLVNIARKSKSRLLREEIVPQSGSTASVGPGYNSRLIQFVREHWDPAAATHASDSLRRFVGRLR